jgi:hypothetical protein
LQGVPHVRQTPVGRPVATALHGKPTVWPGLLRISFPAVDWVRGDWVRPLCESSSRRIDMTPLTVLVLGLGLVVVGVLIVSEPMRILLIALAAGCFLAALVSLILGETGATDDVGTSWSDPGPQSALRWAGSFAAVGLASLVALIWRAARHRRDRSIDSP